MISDDMISKEAKPVIGKYDVIVTTIFNRKSNKNFVKMYLPFFSPLLFQLEGRLW